MWEISYLTNLSFLFNKIIDMSQVRKFKTGGNTAESSTKKSHHDSKYGHYIVDGKTYDVNDDFISNYVASAKKFDDLGTNRVASYIIDALKSGTDVSIDTLNNRIYGIDKYLNEGDVSRSNIYHASPQSKKMHRKYRRKEINKNSNLHQTNVGIKNLGSIQFISPKETTPTPTLIDLYGEDRTLDYNKNADGTVTWSTGPQNAGNIAHINTMFDFLGMSDEEADKKYNYKGKENWIRDLRKWYIDNQNYKEGLIDRMISNQLTGHDWDVLRWMGFIGNESSESSESSDSSTSVAKPRSPEGSGFNNDALTSAGFYVQQGNDGNYYLLNNDGSVYNTPWYLRDEDLFKGTQWEGGSVVGGRLYTRDQTFNQNTDASNTIQALINAQGGEGTPEEIFQAMKNTGIRFAGSNLEHSPYIESFNRSKNTLKGFDDIFLDGDYYIRDITSSYNIPQNHNGLTILSYLNKNNGRDYDQRLREQYAIYDPNNQGQYQRMFKSIEELQNYLSDKGITDKIGIQTPHRLDIQNYILHPENGRRLIQSDDERSVTIGEGDQAITFDIYRDDDGNYYTRGLNNNIILLLGSKILEKIKNGTVTHNEMLRGYADEDNPKFWGGDDGKFLFWKLNPKWKYERYKAGSYDDYFRFKNGGRIPILQYGGKTLTAQSVIDRDKESKDRVGQASKAFGAQKAVKTSTDKMSKAAGWLDTAGASATFIPGYGNIAGAVTGAIGSLLRLGADIQRDGAQMSDFTKFAGNIGLDLLTLIPGAGSAAKAAKIAKGANAVKDASKISKGIKQVAEPVLNFIGNNSRKITGITSGAGIIGGGAMAGSAIFGDGEFTSDDFATAAQGVFGVTGGIKNLRNLKKSAEAIQTIAGKKTFDKIKNQEGDKWGKRVSNAWKNWRGNRKTNSENKKSIRSLMFNDRLVNRTLQESLKNNPNLRKLAIDKNGNFDEALFSRLQNEMGQFLSRTGQTYTLNGKTITGQQINPAWYNGQQFTTVEKSNILALPSHISTNPIKQSVLQLPTWKGNNIPEVNILPSSNTIITTPPSPLIQMPQSASLYRNAQGQLLLPRGDGKFFSKTQRVWGGIAHQNVPIEPVKYSKTPRSSRYRNIGLEQAHKQKVLQEAGKQQVSAIRGLQEDIAKVRTSEDFKNLLVKINNRGSYKEIIKNNPEIKDQLRQMFVHLDPVRLGKWMTKYNLRFKKGGKIIKAQPGVSLKPGDFVMDNDLNDNLYDYQKHGIILNGNNIDWDKTYKVGSDFDTMRQVYITNWDDPDFANVKQAYINQLSSNNNNIDLTNFSLQNFRDYTSDGKLGWAHKLRTKAYDDYISMLPPAEITVETAAKAPETNSKISTQSRVGGAGNAYKEITKKPFSFRWNPDDLIGLANLGYSVHKNNQMFEATKNAIRAAGRALQKQMPTEIYDRYQDHITPIYQEAANSRRHFIPTSTDPLLNYTMRQANEEVAQSLLTEGRLKASEKYTDYLDKDLAARRAYADQRWQIADQNRSIMANIIMQLNHNDVARRLANNQSVQNYVGEMRTKLAQDRQRKFNFMQQEDAIMAQRKYDEYINKKMAEGDYYNQFNALDADKKKQYLNAQDWLMQTNSDVYNNIVNGASVEALNYKRATRPKYLDYFRIDTAPLSTITPTSSVSMPAYITFKKGGKTPKYTQRHTGQKPDEAIWIQRNKDTAKALEKLHDAVIKLFMKALS